MAGRACSCLAVTVLLLLVLQVVNSLAEPGAEAGDDYDQADAAGEANDLVRQLQSEIPGAAAIDPATIIPAYSEQVPQVELYEAGDELTSRARAGINDNEAASAVNDSANLRQNIVLDKDHDPMLQRAKTIINDAGDIVGLSGTESECIVIPPGDSNPGTTSTERCTSWNVKYRNCNHNCYCSNLAPVITGMKSSDNISTHYDMPDLLLFSGDSEADWDSAWGGYIGRCKQHDAQLTFMVNDITAVKDFSLHNIEWKGSIRLELNGNQVFIGPYPGNKLQLDVSYTEYQQVVRYTDCHIVPGPVYGCVPAISSPGRCCRYHYRPITIRQYKYTVDYGVRERFCIAGTWKRQPRLDLKPWLKPGLNTLTVRNIALGAGGFRVRFKAVTGCSCLDPASAGDGGCDHLLQDEARGICELQQQSCLDGEELCRREERSYICLGNTVHEEPYCGELRQRGCTWSASECMDTDENDNCIEYEHQYQCAAPAVPVPQLEDCGARISCIDGNCTDTSYSTSQDFASTASYLSAIEEIAGDFDSDSLSVFSGGGYSCKKTILGFANCCRDKGWGVSLGLSRCSHNERILGEKRQAGQCHYVGSYKSGSLFNKKRYHVFCCFSSKLGRVIQQQGRIQLGLDWGVPTAPSCRGLSTEELGMLDFEQVDLSEVHDDMMRQATEAELPASSVLGERLRQRLQEMQ